MTNEILYRLEKLNQLTLTDEQKADVLAFFAKQEKEIEALYTCDTEQVERMVHVMPLSTVVREDIEIKKFERDDLQKGAPETTDGYWQVPRTVD